MAKKIANKKSKPGLSPGPSTDIGDSKKVIAEVVDDSALELSADSSTDLSAEASPSDLDEMDLSEIENSITKVPALSTPQSKNKSLTTSDPVTSYLAEIRKYALLTREQEQALAQKYYDTKDPAAAQALVTANLRFVVKVAAEYSKFGARMIDLIQEGNLGLMHAVRDFNPYKGVRLITYAVWWIRGYIQEYLMKQFSMVKIGTTQNQKKLFYQLQRERDALDALGERPDIKTIASKLGIPEDEVEMMAQRMSGRDVSLDRPMHDDSPLTVGDLQRANTQDLEEQLWKQEELSLLKDKIEELRPELNAREIILLEERLLNDEPLTLQEIGEKYGITREAVRQAEVRLLKKIKEKFES